MMPLPWARRQILGLLAALLGAGLATAGSPTPTFACSCVASTIHDWIGKPDVAIFTGTAGPALGDEVPIFVSRWFQGPRSTAVIMTPQGEEASCGVFFEPGAWIIVARASNGRIEPSLCLPHARLTSTEGQAMLGAALSAASVHAPRESGAAPPPGLAGAIAIGITGGLAVLVAVGLVLRRRPEA